MQILAQGNIWIVDVLLYVIYDEGIVSAVKDARVFLRSLQERVVFAAPTAQVGPRTRMFPAQIP
jgi:hypothetical protein